MKKHKICAVQPGSIAEELEIEPGDCLLTINDHEIKDIFDYQFLTENEELDILIEKPDGEQQLCQIEKDEDMDLGIVFEKGLMDDYKSCSNSCVFCFIDQNPPGMRETIYFKDDDSRLSFLQGNYVTLTNMKDEDLKRIIAYRLSPINISVHTMNRELRCRMLNNRFAGELPEKMEMLFAAGIPMNAQIVLCRGINDGDELRYTLKELMRYKPYLESVSVVPVGLTDYREGLCHLEPFTPEDAASVIDLIEAFQRMSLERGGNHFVHASDEWYILSGRDFPDEDSYDGYLQLENGVGMTRLLMDEFYDRLRELQEEPALPGEGGFSGEKRRVSLICGLLIYPVIKKLGEDIEKGFPGRVEVLVIPVKNRFFGERITVTGLLTGGDIVAGVKDLDIGDLMLLPDVTLRRDEDIFLDDMTLDEFRERISVPVKVIGAEGGELLDTILGI